MFDKITILGLGLIGSSLCHVIREKGLAKEIHGFDIDPATRDRAISLNLADTVHETAKAAVESADLIILCVPIGANKDLVASFAVNLKPGAILSDVGSVKSAVLKNIAPLLDKAIHFIPAHPVAGTEQSGPDAGFASLFKNRWCILTPPENVNEDALDSLSDFWRRCGSNVEIMTSEHHDKVLAITSHIPHLIAFNIVGTAADMEAVTRSEVIKFSAGGFRDFTRIAASNPTMWRDIFLHNKDAVLEILGRFSEDLAVMQRAIRWGDGDALYTLFERSGSIRRGIIDAGQETDAPDFGRNYSPIEDKS